MFSASLFVVLSIGIQATANHVPTWQTDYAQARVLGSRIKRPLAVFVGSGKAGWNQVAKEGDLGTAVSQHLAGAYVCVYLDSSKAECAKLISAFGLEERSGVILSDRSGRLQAFRHDGRLSQAELDQYVSRFADPDHVVARTETKRIERAAYYEPSTQEDERESWRPERVSYSRNRGNC